MAENAIQTVQKFLQDVLAPDVRELKAEMTALKENMDLRFNALEEKFDLKLDALGQRMELLHKILIATMSESRAQSELSNLTFKAEIGERMAVFEAKHL